jgi:hypothetical protein
MELKCTRPTASALEKMTNKKIVRYQFVGHCLGEAIERCEDYPEIKEEQLVTKTGSLGK